MALGKVGRGGTENQKIVLVAKLDVPQQSELDVIG